MLFRPFFKGKNPSQATKAAGLKRRAAMPEGMRFNLRLSLYKAICIWSFPVAAGFGPEIDKIQK